MEIFIFFSHRSENGDSEWLLYFPGHTERKEQIRAEVKIYESNIQPSIMKICLLNCIFKLFIFWNLNNVHLEFMKCSILV